MITASSVKFQHLLPWQKQFGAFQQLHHHKMALTRTQKKKKKRDLIYLHWSHLSPSTHDISNYDHIKNLFTSY